MKQISRSKKSFLWQALLASTLISAFSAPAYSFTNITTSTDTNATPSVDGYNFITFPNITLTVQDADNIQFTIVGGTDNVSIANDNGGAGVAGTVVSFVGSSDVFGQIGFGNPIGTVNLQGAGDIVNFEDDINLSNGMFMTADGRAVFATGVSVLGNIDNTAGAGKGILEFEGTGSVIGNIGATNAFNQVITNSTGVGGTVVFSSFIAKANTFLVDDNGVTPATLSFTNPDNVITGNITTNTNNLNTIRIAGGSLTGDIGTNATRFATFEVGSQKDVTVDGNIYATTTEFQANKTLSLTDAHTINGNVSSLANGSGTLQFQGGGGVTGTIGTDALNRINQVSMNGAGKIVNLGGNVFVTNGVNFSGASNTASTLNLADGVTITGNLNNLTAASAGIVNFLGSGGVTGTTGATNSINTINLNGGAGKTVYLQGNTTVGAGNLNFAAGSTATSVLELGTNVTVTGNIDNTSGTANVGIVNFDNSGKVTGTIGATNSINTINVANKAIGTVEFDGNVTATTTNIANNGTASYADNVIVTGAIDSTAANTGTVNFFGSGQVTGNIGNTNSLFQMNLNSLAINPNETIELNGAVVKATTIFVNDDGATPTTLTLNNAAMQLMGHITTTANDLDILNVLNATQITGIGGVAVGAAGNEFNLMKVAQNGNLTVDGDIFANNVQFQGNNALTLTDNSNINGNVTTTANNQGILQLQGTTDITGTIGSAGLALNAINLLGPNETLTLGNDTFVNNINIANDGTVIIEDGKNFTGNINNTSGVDGKGDIEFEGTGSISGTIGASNTLDVISVNTSAGAGEIVTLSGNLIRVNEIDVFGATTQLKLDNASMVLSTTNGIQSKTAGSNTLDINQAALINSDIGTTGKFNLIKVGAVGNTIINGDIVATTTQFQGNNKLSLTDGSDVTGAIDSTAANQGILELRGDHTITGNIGATNSLNTINVIGKDGVVNLQGTTIKSSSINYSGLANCATTINLADGVTVTGNITNTTGTANVGTLNFAGNGTVNGTIGQANPVNSLCQINLQGAAGKIVTFQNDVQVGTGNINFLQDSQLNIADNADITGNIDTDAPSQGTVNYLGNSVVNGLLGVSNDLKLVQLSGAAGKVVAFNQNVNTDEMRFTANGTATLASGISVSGPITTTANNQGNLTFLGNFTIDQPIGAAGKALNTINASGPAGTTVTLLDDIFATNTNVNNGGTFLALEPHTIGGNLNLSNASTLAVASAGAPLTITGDLNVPAGTTLKIDLNNINIPTYIKVNDQAFIDANSTLVLTNTPQAYASGIYDIKLVDATNLGNIQVPQNVVGDSLLLTFDVEAQNAPNNDLLLHIDVLPVSLFADRPNTIGVAGALDAMAGQDFLGSLQNLLDQLPYFTTKEQLNDALAALAPIVDGSYTQEIFAAQLLGYGAVSDRIRYLRQRKNVPVVGKGFESGLSSGDDWDDNGHGRWFKLYGQYSDQGTRDSVAGYNSETWGVAIGSDVSLNDLNLIGVSANLSHTYVGHDVSDSKSSIYSLQAAIYGEQDFCDWWYFNWVTSVAYNKYTTERNFVFGLLPLSPQADFVGWQFGTKGELGYEYLYRNWHVIPNTSLYFSHLALNGYNESGAGTASQSVDSHSYNMLKAGVGVRAAYRCPMEMPYRIRPIIFQPEVRMNAFYDFINDNMETTSNFTGGGPSFTTLGAVPAASSFNLGASLSVFSDYNDYIVTISYDYETKRDYNANAGFLRLRYEW